MKVNNIGFIGLGLIGGSLARRIRKIFPDMHLTVYGTRAADKAIDDGIIDYKAEDLSDLSDMDIIFLCAPVRSNVSYLEKLKNIIKDECILTDVGSVKSDITNKACELDIDSNFVGGHPMAGSEKNGYEASTDYLLENAYYPLTVTSKTKKEYIDYLYNFIVKIGSIPLIIEADSHDECVAAISHIPHIIAFSLVNLVKNNDTENETMKQIAAGGFKDITRIASSSPDIWRDILLSNKKAILKFMELYMSELNYMKQMIMNEDADNLFDSILSSKEYRDGMTAGNKGLIQKTYELYVDIIDETGALATIATVLARKNISISNIGIINNREYKGGVLKIVFHSEEALESAKKILIACDYIIYE